MFGFRKPRSVMELRPDELKAFGDLVTGNPSKKRQAELRQVKRRFQEACAEIKVEDRVTDHHQ